MAAKPNRTVKDSVFRMLFSDPEYRFRLYRELRALSPAYPELSMGELEDVTLEEVLGMEVLNDLAFLAGNLLMIFIEEQTSYDPNIALRIALYWAKTILGDLDNRSGLREAINNRRRVSLPVMQFYVVLADDGKRRNVPEYQTLTESLHVIEGIEPSVSVSVRVITKSEEPTIINEYLAFVRIVNEERGLHGNPEKDLEEAVRRSIREGILAGFLRKHRSEVVHVLKDLFSAEVVFQDRLNVAIREATEKAREEAREEALAEGLEEGREEGRKQGREEGRAEGREEGRAEEHAKLLSIAKNLVASRILTLDELPEHFPDLTDEDLECIATSL